MTEYTNLLRNGILEAYSGIFQGFKSSPKTQLLMPYAPHILPWMMRCPKTAIELLGDVADTLGSNVLSLIQLSVSSDDHLIKKSAEWAKNDS